MCKHYNYPNGEVVEGLNSYNMLLNEKYKSLEALKRLLDSQKRKMLRKKAKAEQSNMHPPQPSAQEAPPAEPPADQPVDEEENANQPDNRN